MGDVPEAAWSKPTGLLPHVNLVGVVPDGEGEVEPAVVLVLLLADGPGEGLVGGLWELLSLLHANQYEVLAVLLTGVLLIAGLEGQTLHTIPEGRERERDPCDAVQTQREYLKYFKSLLLNLCMKLSRKRYIFYLLSEKVMLKKL